MEGVGRGRRLGLAWTCWLTHLLNLWTSKQCMNGDSGWSVGKGALIWTLFGRRPPFLLYLYLGTTCFPTTNGRTAEIDSQGWVPWGLELRGVGLWGPRGKGGGTGGSRRPRRVSGRFRPFSPAQHPLEPPHPQFQSLPEPILRSQV